MRVLLVFCAVLVVLVAVVHAGEWYEGGTLHKVTAREWHLASAQNRLATSADFVASTDSAGSMSQLKKRAYSVSRCISEATDPPSLYNLAVSEIAALCILQLGYK